MTEHDARTAFFERNLDAVRRDTGQVFFWLLIVQWAFAIGVSLTISPYGWDGAHRHVHMHVRLAIGLGAAINALPLWLLRAHPSWWGTRHTVAVAQMLWSAMLVMITGGRVETHFHVFGSLAFLAFYRDWKLLPTATLVVAADHLARGLVWPESVYGVANPEWWRFLEHAAWVAFEDVVLVLGCFRSLAEMRVVADREAGMAALNEEFEQRVEARTAELSVANTSLAREMQSRLAMEAELRQAQKLEAVGRLASGIAHEINTPVQFVADSVHYLQAASHDLLGLIDKLEVVQRSVLADTPSRAAAEDAEAEKDAADLEYVREHVPKAIDRSLDGLARVATIVRSMKSFAHPDGADMTTIDLNAAIETTLVIARTEYKYVADVETAYGDLPPVCCFAGDVNQAILNIIVNAAHAIGDAVKGTRARGRIRIATRLDGGDAVVSIADSGTGIPPAIRDKIFDPFFTTKEVGKGTGQGLAIVRNVVVEKHGGAIDVESEVGRGTTFHLRLPVAGRAAAAQGAAA